MSWSVSYKPFPETDRSLESKFGQEICICQVLSKITPVLLHLVKGTRGERDQDAGTGLYDLNHAWGIAVYNGGVSK
jgi:hypothetical protein